MKIVIAPDSFKGSITAKMACSIMKQAVVDIDPGCQIVLKPMADGGEGTLESINTALQGKEVRFTCTGPLGQSVKTSYAIVAEKRAVIECASIAGLTQVPEESRDPDLTTSYGIGEAMIHALDQGCTSIIIGLGGSATNDGGLGMLQALGLKAYDVDGYPCGSYGRDMLDVASVDLTQLDGRLAEVVFEVANDVDNPLCGDNGATAVYGPQKGADQQQVLQYDKALKTYGRLIEEAFAGMFMDQAGAGAAGGLGFALLALGAHMEPGAKLVAEHIDLEEAIKQADLVLTGEGQSDQQTLYGKAPGYVAGLAATYRVPTILISGSLSDDTKQLRQKFSGCFSIGHKPLTLEELMADAERLLLEQTRQVIHFWKSVRA